VPIDGVFCDSHAKSDFGTRQAFDFPHDYRFTASLRQAFERSLKAAQCISRHNHPIGSRLIDRYIESVEISDCFD